MERMRRFDVLAIAIALAIAVLFAGCAGQQNQSQENVKEADSESTSEQEAQASEEPAEQESQIPTVAFGEKVSTDLVEVTLNDASFAIALVDPGMNRFKSDENSLLPKEYDSAEDSDNRYVASKGHSYVSMQFTINNLDRNELTLSDFTGVPFEFATVEYKDQEYGMSKYSPSPSVEDSKWYPVGHALDAVHSLDIGMEGPEEVRGVIELPVEPDDLSDVPNIIVTLPNSDGTTTSYKYSK